MEQKTIANLTVYFKEKIFKIYPMILSEEDGTLELINLISTEGTEKLKFLKLPLSETSFIILNKYQLDNSIIEIKLDIKKERKKRVKKIETVN